MMIGVTKWAYDQASIDNRDKYCGPDLDPAYCKNEEWFIKALSKELQEKFGLERNLTFAFMDSYSQWAPNLNDEVQQSHWINETNKLWYEATSRNETFDFKTIDDVLEENALCKEENERLNDIISEDIKQLKDNVTSLDNAISEVNDEVTSLSNTVDTNTASISDVSDEVLNNGERISIIHSSVTVNTKHIEDNCESITVNTDSITNVAMRSLMSTLKLRKTA